MRVALNIEPNHLIEYLHSLVDASAKVSADSRQIRSGDIFFAYPVGHGNALRDGRQYIDAALSNGASVVVFDPANVDAQYLDCLLYTSPSPRDGLLSRMPSSA